MTNDHDNAPLMLDCGSHGRRIATVVCQHMLNGAPSPAGFIENNDDPHDLQAWCHGCEELYLEEGGMTDAFQAFNNMAVVCVVCYQEAKARHTIPTNDGA